MAKSLTMKPAPAWQPCHGEAHGPNNQSDHCGVCMPYWGSFPTCPTCVYDRDGFVTSDLRGEPGAPVPLRRKSRRAVTRFCPKCGLVWSDRELTESRTVKVIVDDVETAIDADSPDRLWSYYPGRWFKSFTNPNLPGEAASDLRAPCTLEGLMQRAEAGYTHVRRGPAAAFERIEDAIVAMKEGR